MISIKPGCDKRLEFLLPGISLGTVEQLEVLIRRSCLPGEPLLTFGWQAGQSAQGLEVTDEKVVLLLKAEQTALLPQQTALWLDILPRMQDGARPAVDLVPLHTTTTLKEVTNGGD